MITLQSRPEIDKSRIALHGVSWGAYWATKMAIVEHARLRGASAQSPMIDKSFPKDFLMNSLLGNREYLFDQVPALMAILEGVNTLEEMARSICRRCRWCKQGLLGKPMAPMLILAGVSDTQVPIDDEYLLLSKGDVPKDSLDQSSRRSSRAASWSVARSAHLQRGDHSVAGAHA